jgi:uncharacterized protein (DUF1697 family)
MKYLAFLRAINVGGHVVKMEPLAAIFRDMGLANVETFIASGNVIFDSSARNAATLERKIEAALKSALGYEVATFLRTPAALAKVAAYQPFPGCDAFYVGFLGAEPSAEAQKKALALGTAVDELHIAGSEIYWLCSVKANETKISNAALERALGMSSTLRNVNTVRRLVAKYPG